MESRVFMFSGLLEKSIRFLIRGEVTTGNSPAKRKGRYRLNDDPRILKKPEFLRVVYL